MDSIFISYSRADGDFVRRLHAALAAHGHDAWVDWEGIPPSDTWMATIRGAIDAAEAAIFVLSPEWVASEVCGQELAHAVARNKRLIPILHREPGAPVPPQLAEINYIFGRDTDNFENFIETLSEAIETDLDRVRAHTRLLVRAAEWDREGRDTSFTLRGSDLTAFEDWAAAASDREPRPTALQTEYLVASRRAVTRRQQITWASVAAGLAIAAVLGTVAWFQMRESARQAQIVEARQSLTRAAFLRDAPPSEATSLTQYDRSVRFAALALKALDRLGGDVRDADLSLRKSIARRIPWQRQELGYSRIRDATFSRDGRRAAVSFAGGGVKVYDTETGKEVAACNPDPAAGPEQQIAPVALSDDGAMLAGLDGKVTGEPARVRVWTLPDCAEVAEVEVPDAGASPPIRQMALSSDGAYLVLLLRKALRIRTSTGEWVEPALHPGSRPRRIALSPDGTRIALYETWKTAVQRVRVLKVWSLGDPSDLRNLRLAEGANDLRWRDDGFWINGRMMVERDGALEPVAPDAKPLFSGPAVLNADGSLVATAKKDRPITIAETATGRIVAEIPKGAPAARLSFLPTTGRIAVLEPGKRTLGVLDYDGSDTAYATLEAQPLQMDGIGFSADGRMLLARAQPKRLGWKMPEPGAGTAPARTDPGRESPVPLRSSALPAAGDELGPAPEIEGTEGRVYRILEGEPTRGGPRRTLELLREGKVVVTRQIGPMLNLHRSTILSLTGWGRFLVHAENDGLRILDAATLEPVAAPLHRRAIAAAVTRDGRLAATLDVAGEVRVHDLKAGTEDRRFPVDRIGPAMALREDGRWLAVLANPAEADLYALSPADLVAQACRDLPAPCPGERASVR